LILGFKRGPCRLENFCGLLRPAWILPLKFSPRHPRGCQRDGIIQNIFWGFVLFFVFFVSPTLGAEVPRYILALYDSTEEYNQFEDNNLAHNNAEMVLNYLGMKVRFHDIASGLPEESDSGKVFWGS